MSRNTEHLTWVLQHMPVECEAALAQFTKVNTHWNGAAWDDCLDALLDADAGLEFTEPLWEDAFLLEHCRIAGAVALTLVWADESFTQRTDEERMAIVHEWLREGGVGTKVWIAAHYREGTPPVYVAGHWRA